MTTTPQASSWPSSVSGLGATLGGGQVPGIGATSTTDDPDLQRLLVLALLQRADSRREYLAWLEEAGPLSRSPAALSLHERAVQLPSRARLPLLEQTLQQLRTGEPAQRAELLRAARRLMSADGRISALDRLRWLLLRHRLAHQPRATAPMIDRARAEQALADLPRPSQEAIACVTAYLARLVPENDPLAKIGTAGVSWYRVVLRSFWFDAPPSCQVPDNDRMVLALAELQGLSWMQRPVLTRTWVRAAVKVSQRLWRGEPLRPEAAEALRIATNLLDCPPHPALSDLFDDLGAQAPCLASEATSTSLTQAH